jgi:ubiquitin-conjugating enzyme E2 variant
MEVVEFLAALLATVLLADLVSGLVHWWEDAYARAGDGPLGRVARDNLRHHARPREFLAKGYWASSWDLWLLGAVVVAAAFVLDALSWHVVLFVVLVANANQVHKWAHMRSDELPRLVRWAQRMQLLQTTRHHSKHHQGTRNTHYCVLTNVLNPVLEELQLWSRVERVIEKLTGIARRDDEVELAKMGLATRAAAAAPRSDFRVRLTQAVLRGVHWRPARAALAA